MFLFLIVTGTVLIAYGTWALKEEKAKGFPRSEEVVLDGISNLEAQKDLDERVHALESFVYGFREEQFKETDALTVTEEEEVSFEEVLGRQLKKEGAAMGPDEKNEYDISQERQKLFKGMDKGYYSMEMVCSILGMEKGEVLLLRNIYKNYQE